MCPEFLDGFQEAKARHSGLITPRLNRVDPGGPDKCQGSNFLLRPQPYLHMLFSAHHH